MFKATEDFPFIPLLEQNWHVMRDELLTLRSERFLAWPEKHLYESGWDVFGLIAFGIEIQGNCQLCPKTAELVAAIPGIVTAGFSSLKPGTHIAPHTGYPDGVLRGHLGLLGCHNCALRVGEEVRSWEEGSCFIFDDTTEHEAWNHGTETRIVLLFDFRYPLTPDRGWGQKLKQWFNLQ